MDQVPFSDLQTKGYVVVPSFLSGEQLDLLRKDYAERPLQAENANYNLAGPSPEAYRAILIPIRDVLKRVLEQTDVRADTPVGGSYFATGRGVNFAWHQDHESFFALQNHYDYLNFYIPIIKPRRDKTNLSIVPFDVLERECPRTYRRVVRGGAARLWSIKRRGVKGSVVFQDDSGRVHFMKKSIDDLGITPHLDAGDLLLCRGDMIHKTQDVETERVAFSVRACASGIMVKHSRLADGGVEKIRMMANNPILYKRMLMAFEHTRKEELSLADLNKVIKSMPAPAPESRRRFMTYLFKAKVRTGTIAHFVPRAVASAAVELMARRR
jgi:hypothetical protein